MVREQAKLNPLAANYGQAANGSIVLFNCGKALYRNLKKQVNKGVLNVHRQTER